MVLGALQTLGLWHSVRIALLTVGATTLPIVQGEGVLLIFWSSIGGVAVGLWMVNNWLQVRSRIPLLKTHRTEETRLAGVLQTMMNEDAENPGHVLSFQQLSFQSALDDLGGPYLLFKCSARTGSVYQFEFQQPIEGHIQYQGHDLARLPEMLHGVRRMSRRNGGEVRFEIRQFLEPQTAKDIRAIIDAKGRLEFEFSAIRIPMQTYRPDGSRGDVWELPVPSRWNVDTSTLRN